MCYLCREESIQSIYACYGVCSEEFSSDFIVSNLRDNHTYPCIR